MITLILFKYVIYIKLYPLVLAPINGDVSDSVITMVVAKWWLFRSIIFFSFLKLAFFCQLELFCLIYLFICSFRLYSMGPWILFSSMDYKPLLLFLFWYLIVPDVVSRISFRLLPFPSPALRTAILQGLWLFLVRDNAQNPKSWVLGMPCHYSYYCFQSLSTDEVGNMRMFICTHINTCISIFLFISYVYMYLTSWVHTSISNSESHYQPHWVYHPC